MMTTIVSLSSGSLLTLFILMMDICSVIYPSAIPSVKSELVNILFSELVITTSSKNNINRNNNNNKLASLEATLVRNSADPLTDSLTGVKCRATSVAKNYLQYEGNFTYIYLHNLVVFSQSVFFSKVVFFSKDIFLKSVFSVKVYFL